MITKSEKSLLTELLGLPGYKVTDKKMFDGIYLVLFVESESQEAVCPHCGNLSHKIHQNHYHMIKDLPWNNQDVMLEVNRRQFKCKYCKKPFSETLNFVSKRRRYTKRYANQIVEEVLDRDILSVSQRTDLSEYQIQKILEDMGEELLEDKPEGLKDLGIDEIAWVKGQKIYCAVLVNLETHELIGLIKGQTQKDLSEVFDSWGSEISDGVERVSIDLWEPYKNLVKRMMPQAEIVADRFHVMKQVNNELDKARREEVKKAKDLEDKAAKKNKLKHLRKVNTPF